MPLGMDDVRVLCGVGIEHDVDCAALPRDGRKIADQLAFADGFAYLTFLPFLLPAKHPDQPDAGEPLLICLRSFLFSLSDDQRNGRIGDDGPCSGWYVGAVRCANRRLVLDRLAFFLVAACAVRLDARVAGGLAARVEEWDCQARPELGDAVVFPVQRGANLVRVGHRAELAREYLVIAEPGPAQVRKVLGEQVSRAVARAGLAGLFRGGYHTLISVLRRRPAHLAVGLAVGV